VTPSLEKIIQKRVGSKHAAARKRTLFLKKKIDFTMKLWVLGNLSQGRRTRGRKIRTNLGGENNLISGKEKGEVDSPWNVSCVGSRRQAGGTNGGIRLPSWMWFPNR